MLHRDLVTINPRYVEFIYEQYPKTQSGESTIGQDYPVKLVYCHLTMSFLGTSLVTYHKLRARDLLANRYSVCVLVQQ